MSPWRTLLELLPRCPILYPITLGYDPFPIFKPIWKSGPIGNKRELNGSDRKLSGNGAAWSGRSGQSLNMFKDCPRSRTFKRRSVSWSSLIVSCSYESGTQRVLVVPMNREHSVSWVGAEYNSHHTRCKYALPIIDLRCDQALPATQLRPKQTYPRLIYAVLPLSSTHKRLDSGSSHSSNGDVPVRLPIIRVH